MQGFYGGAGYPQPPYAQQYAQQPGQWPQQYAGHPQQSGWDPHAAHWAQQQQQQQHYAYSNAGAMSGGWAQGQELPASAWQGHAPDAPTTSPSPAAAPAAALPPLPPPSEDQPPLPGEPPLPPLPPQSDASQQQQQQAAPPPLPPEPAQPPLPVGAEASTPLPQHVQQQQSVAYPQQQQQQMAYSQQQQQQWHYGAAYGSYPAPAALAAYYSHPQVHALQQGWGTYAVPPQQQHYAAPPHMGMPAPPHIPGARPSAMPPMAAAAAAAAAGRPAQVPGYQHALPAGPAAAPAQPEVAQRRDVLELLQLGPGRTGRPRKLAIVLRGLPGSGKSYAARLIKTKEVEAGGEPPRILSLDDYFMTEVEKEVEEEEGLGGSGNGKRGRKRKVEVLEYQFDPEMEAAYCKDLLRAFQRTVAEGRHRLVVVDSPCCTLAEFKELWSAGQAAGYDVLAAELPDTDPQVCHQRNVHGRSKEDVWRMSEAFEPTPPFYAALDLAGLLGGRSSASSSHADGSGSGRGGEEIREVDMEGEEEEGAAGGAAAAAGAAVNGAAGVHAAGRQERSLDGDGTARPASSRWAALEQEEAAEEAAKVQQAKRSRAAAATGAAAGAAGSAVDDRRDLLGKHAANGGRPGSAPVPASKPRGILARKRPGSAGASGRRVRWPDQAQGEAESGGFRIGGLSQQLETVYVVSGLGPPREDGQALGAEHQSFGDAVRAEHRKESSDFRRLLLGRGGPAS